MQRLQIITPADGIITYTPPENTGSSSTTFIDKGIKNQYTPDKDFLETRRDSLPDIGAFEFSASKTISAPHGLKIE